MKKFTSIQLGSALFVTALVAPSSGVITAVENLNIPIPANFEGVYIDIVNPPVVSNPTQSGSPDNADGSYAVSFSEPSGDWDFNFFFGGIGIAHNESVNPYRTDSTDNLSPIQALGVGEIIDGVTAAASGALPLATPAFGGSGAGSTGTSSSQNHIGTGAFEFEAATKNYIAFVLDPGTPEEAYGWISVTFNDNGSDGIIHDLAFSSVALNVAQIPEPSSSLLLILASMALFKRRR